jgi:peptidoglycan/LPS O-acetylase OafA/YrhL
MGLIRLLLAAAVIATHCRREGATPLLFARLAVQSFYLLSGFYMSLVLTTRYPATSSGRRRFYFNRYLRLMPIYAVVIALSLAVPYLLYLRYHFTYPPWLFWWNHWKDMHWTSLVYFVGSQVFLLGQDWSLFLVFDPSMGTLHNLTFRIPDGVPALSFLFVPPAWSIGVELSFYLLAPFLVRARTRTLMALTVASLALRAALAYHGFAKDPWTYRFFPSELAVFLMGIFAHRFYLSERFARWTRSRLVCPAVFVVCLAVLIGYQRLPHYPGQSALYLAFFATCVPFAFRLTATNRFDAYLAQYSYPLYLVHTLVIWAYSQFHPQIVWYQIYLLSLIACVPLVHFVERPYATSRRRHLSTATVSTPENGTVIAPTLTQEICV